MKKIITIVAIFLASPIFANAQATTTFGGIPCTGPVINGVCRPELGNSLGSACVAGSIQTNADGSRTCQVQNGSQYMQSNICTGLETSGPCRPERINVYAAMNAAAQQSQTTGTQCRAEFTLYPSIDINTGITGGFYQTICEGQFGYDPNDYSRGVGPVGTQTQSSGSGSSVSLNSSSGGVNAQYVSSVINIISKFIESAKKIYGTR